MFTMQVLFKEFPARQGTAGGGSLNLDEQIEKKGLYEVLRDERFLHGGSKQTMANNIVQSPWLSIEAFIDEYIEPWLDQYNVPDEVRYYIDEVQILHDWILSGDVETSFHRDGRTDFEYMGFHLGDLEDDDDDSWNKTVDEEDEEE